MRKTTRNLLVLSVIGLFTNISAANAGYFQEDASVGQPFMGVYDSDGELRKLPLQSIDIKARITATLADVSLVQEFRNDNAEPIEAVYKFPGNAHSAIYSLQMIVDDRIIKAEIQEKQQAEAAYEQAKDEGKAATLLVQDSPTTFSMNVANIAPGSTVKVELKYTEILGFDGDFYRFRLPAVVGPKYGSRKPASGFVSGPGKSDDKTFQTIVIELDAGALVDEIGSETHVLDLIQHSSDSYSITVETAKKAGKTFELKFRLFGEEISEELFLYEGSTENYFLLTLQPPKSLPGAYTVPREYIFIVDVSGSMDGYPIEVSKQLIKNLILSIDESDYFNVFTFASGTNRLASKSIPATPANVDAAVALIEKAGGSGGTELLPALKAAFNSGSPGSQYARTVVIASDGLIDAEAEVFDYIRNNADNTNVFPFGIGSWGTNENLIEGIASISNSEALFIDTEEEAKIKAALFTDYVRFPVLSNITLDFQGFDAYEVDPTSVPSVFFRRPINVLGKWRGETKGKLTITGLYYDQPYSRSINISRAKSSHEYEGLKYLWARNKIRLLGDYVYLSENEDAARQITELGLEYGLLTDYTSFIAVDYIASADGSEPIKIEQPQVSDYWAQSGIGFDEDMTFTLSDYGPEADTAENSSAGHLEFFGKTFEQVGMLWVDRDVKVLSDAILVSKFSETWMQLLRLFPKLTTLDNMDGDVVIAFGEISVRVGDEKRENSDAEIQQLNRHFRAWLQEP